MAFRQFLELDSQIPESTVYLPEKKTEFNELAMGARDFIILRKYGILFLAMSDMNITSRVDAYLTNFSMPWEKKQNVSVAQSVGAVIAVKITPKKENGEIKWSYMRMWSANFPSQTNIMHWNNQSDMLYVGLDNGEVHRYHIPKDSNFVKFTALPVMQPHTSRVMGVSAEPLLNYIYSIGQDGYFVIQDTKCCEEIKDFKHKLFTQVPFNEAKGDSKLIN